MANEITTKKRGILSRVLGGVGKAGKVAIEYSPIGSGKMIKDNIKASYGNSKLKALRYKLIDKMTEGTRVAYGNMGHTNYNKAQKTIMNFIKDGKMDEARAYIASQHEKIRKQIAEDNK